MEIYKKALRKWQREYLMRAILECNGSMIEAAQLIGINRTDFYKKCDRFGIKRTDQRAGRKVSTANRGNEAWQALGRASNNQEDAR